MANPILHIKDSYYFEVPKRLWPSSRASHRDFPDVWVLLDSDFQTWEFERLYAGLAKAGVSLPNSDVAQADWQHWVHANHARHAKPFDEFLESLHQAAVQAATVKGEGPVDAEKLRESVGKSTDLTEKYAGFILRRHDSAWAKNEWAAIRRESGDVAAYQHDANVQEWSPAKVDGYNHHLSGKILIPQPFGQLRNLYEGDSGLCVSRFMIIELVVAAILCVTFSWLSGRVRGGAAPQGKLWNLLESFVVFIRDGIAGPAIGHHDSQRFTPLLCTLFFFILGCNLFGMIPWTGAPTGAFGTTFGLACVTFLTVVVSGVLRFGPVGFFLNMVPGMDLPKVLFVPIAVGILAIELLGLLIKHLVLSIRLLANMMAGHLVLLGVMGLAFGTHAAVSFSGPDVAAWSWPVTASIAVVGSTLFSILELFVAFLQAYIFTFLSALFIGAAIHHH